MVHPTSVTNIVDRLETQGFVRRVPHPTDRRTTLCEITDRGRKVCAEATDAVVDIDIGITGLTDRDADQLTRSSPRCARRPATTPDAGPAGRSRGAPASARPEEPTMDAIYTATATATGTVATATPPARTASSTSTSGSRRRWVGRRGHQPRAALRRRLRRLLPLRAQPGRQREGADVEGTEVSASVSIGSNDAEGSAWRSCSTSTRRTSTRRRRRTSSRRPTRSARTPTPPAATSTWA